MNRTITTFICVLALVAVATAMFLIDDRQNSLEAKHLQIRGCLQMARQGEIEQIARHSRLGGQKFRDVEAECKQILADWDRELKIKKKEEFQKFLDTFDLRKDDYNGLKDMK